MNKLIYLTGRYTEEELELAGKAEAFLDLANLLNINSSVICSLSIPDSLPEPYDGFLEKMSISQNNRLLCINRKEATLYIAGSFEVLRLLAENIDIFSQYTNKPQINSVKPHLHIDYYPSHMYLHPTSQSLVMVMNT